MKKFLLPFLFLCLFKLAAQQPKEIQKSIYFGGGSWFIDEEQAGDLQQTVQKIPNLEFYEISIMSHTDPVGGREFNEYLSHRRSQSVIDLLIHFKVPQEIIRFKDFAFDAPAFDNATWEGRARNRRVDILFTPITF